MKGTDDDDISGRVLFCGFTITVAIFSDAFWESYLNLIGLVVFVTSILFYVQIGRALDVIVKRFRRK